MNFCLQINIHFVQKQYLYLFTHKTGCVCISVHPRIIPRVGLMCPSTLREGEIINTTSWEETSQGRLVTNDIEARSRNHCCRGKVINITCFQCVCSLSCQTRKMHAQYYTVMYGLFDSTTFFHITSYGTHAHTHTEICNTYSFCTATVVTRTRLNVTLYLHCLSCYHMYHSAMVKATFNNKKTLLTSKLDLNLGKKLVKCYIWSI